MLTITRYLAEQLKKAFRQALSTKTHSRGPMPPVEFVGGPQGVRIRCHTREAAVEFRLDGEHPQETILAPWELLTDTSSSGGTGGSGRERPVELRCENGGVLASWHSGSVPRVVQYDTPPAPEEPWPDSPEQFAENRPELLRALADAAATTTTGPSRYALRCLQLDGAEGRIFATDGRQLLVQSGFAFPWEGRLLVPASRVFGSAELQPDGPVRVGRTDDRFVLETGRWTFSWRLDRDGRFPKVERLLPDPAAAVARLELAASDLSLLAENLPHLPGDELPHAPVTRDLNGTVAVRARGQEPPPGPHAAAGVELILSGAGRSGEPIRIQTDRRFLRRAASLGLPHIHLFGTQQPVLAWDERRRYAWAVLDARACIEPSETMTRIESPAPGRVASVDFPRPSIPRSTNTPMPRSSTTSTSNSAARSTNHEHAKGNRNGNTDGNGHARSDSNNGQPTGAIEQVIALRSTLREAAAQATELVRILKAEKRQTRQLRSALSSLKELQPLEL